jgi:hypothetical protein
VEFGTYYPLEVIVKKESGYAGSKTGYEAGLNICRSCIALGGKWVRMSMFSKRLEFLYCKAGFENRFEQAWAEHTERRKRKEQEALAAPTEQQQPKALTNGEHPDSAACGATPAGDAQPAKGTEQDAAAAAAAKAKPTGRKKAQQQATQEEGGKSKRQKTTKGGAGPAKQLTAEEKKIAKEVKKNELKFLTAAQHTATLYGTVTTQAQMMLNMLDTCSAWSWMKTCEDMGEKLKSDVKAVTEAVIPGEFIEQFLVEDINHVKETRGEAAFNAALADVSATLDQPIAQVQAQLKWMRNTQAQKELP